MNIVLLEVWIDYYSNGDGSLRLSANELRIWSLVCKDDRAKRYADVLAAAADSGTVIKEEDLSVV